MRRSVRARQSFAEFGIGIVAAVACASCAADVAAGARAEGSAALEAQTPGEAAGWRSQVLYLVVTDRFRNGDPSNDDAGAPGCHAPGDPHRFHGGDLEGVRQNLAHVRAVGATAVWLTPLYRQVPRLPNGDCGYHGYWADYVSPDDGAIEPKLGSAADLTRFVGDAHAAGVKVVLDMVVNHTGDIAQLPKVHPEWFHDPRTCGGLGDPTIFCPVDGHPDFAQERPDVAAFLSNAAARWVTTYGVDGIRMDTAKHVLPSYFKNSFFPAVRANKPGLFAVGEVFDEGSAASYVPYVDAGFDGTFHFELRRALVDGIAHGGSVDPIANAVADGIGRLGMGRALDLVLMMDNHDVPRFVNEPGVGVPEDEIRRRLLLALDLLFTLPGVPQLYAGDEVGLYGGADPDNRRDLPAWVTDAGRRGGAHPGDAVTGADLVFARTAALTRLRTTTPALVDGAYRELWRQNGARNPNVLAFARGTGAGARVVVVSNGGAHTGTVRIPVPAAVFPDGATLTDELGDGAPAAVTLTGGSLVVDLPGKSAAIYRLKP
jgi:alpha-amylase